MSIFHGARFAPMRFHAVSRLPLGAVSGYVVNDASRSECLHRRRAPVSASARLDTWSQRQPCRLSRVSDGLPLAASMEDEKDHRELDAYKAQAKKIIKTLSAASPGKMTIESGGSTFQ